MNCVSQRVPPLLCAIFVLGASNIAFAKPLNELPANEWVLLHEEGPGGGKAFSQAIYAVNVGRVYLWGIGGEKPARNVYQRYELEAIDFDTTAWRPAFPKLVWNDTVFDSNPRQMTNH